MISEDELDETLAALPRRVAPAALRAKLEAMAPAPPPAASAASPAAPVRRARPRWLVPAVSALAGAAVAFAIALLVLRPGPRPPDGADLALAREAVDDHLRLVYSEHPLEVAASDMHAVKPWFTGRLDFAPVLTFVGDDQFVLQGGAVGVYADRKCAVIAWKKRLHAITLIVVPAAGLDFPDAPRAGRDRGFATLVWRAGDLGYALVSDVDPADLARLQARLAPGGDSR